MEAELEKIKNHMSDEDFDIGIALLCIKPVKIGNTRMYNAVFDEEEYDRRMKACKLTQIK